MKTRYWLPPLLLAALGYGSWKLIEWRNRPPQVPFARAKRETIASSVSTNGKVEAEQWAVARAETAGAVTRILAGLNQQVTAGAVLVELDTSEARAALEAAQARVEAARAELALYESGGRASERASLQSQIENARTLLQQAEADYRAESAAEQKGVATKQQVNAARNRVEQLQNQIAALQQQINNLVTPAEREAAQARLREAETARQAAQLRIARSVVRAPMAGTVYRFDLKPGAYLNPGDEVAAIGRLERVHVHVFVDEPELGRVAAGKPVTITWDAMPGRVWNGKVDRMPVRIVELGTRQVGEVVCVIDNPGRELPPGANVTAVILSEATENAITIPKEALFRSGGQTGVYVLDSGDRLAWRTVTQGVSNVTRVQVFELQEGAAVALPSEAALRDAMVVLPAFDPAR